ncbi:MAG: DUF6527 family protein [Clostridia bacterium]|nr:DUF6527 family protein [Clostridia bacterium]
MKVTVGNDGSFTFKCPGCGNWHTLNTPDNVRWNFNGDVDKPTFYPPVICEAMNAGGIICHCMVRDGMIQFLPDSSHHLAGETVELPDI